MGRRHEHCPKKNPDSQHTPAKMLNCTHHEGNANQNHDELPLYTLRNRYNQKRQTITSVGEEAEKLQPWHLTGGNIKHAAAVENSLEAPQKVNIIHYDPVILHLDMYLPKRYVCTKICTWMFTAALFVITKK